MRQVAVHMYIKELLDGVYTERPGWEPNVVKCARGEVTRVNIIGVLLREQNNLFLDDGSASIPIRVFDDIPGLDTPSGSIVQVIARPRQYQDSLYLNAEIIKAVSSDWARVRKHELGSLVDFDASSVAKPTQEQTQEEVVVDNKAEHVIEVISGSDSGEGVFIEDVISNAQLESSTVEQIIDQLLLDGEIFEIKPGVLKVL